MPVQTNKGDGDGDMCIIRRAPNCSFMTDWWWGTGCITVCSACAKLPDVTDASMRALCERGGWGPIPAENTDLGGEDPTSPA